MFSKLTDLYQQVSRVRDAVRFSNPGGQCGGHNMPPWLVGFTEFQNSGWAKTNPAHPLTASLSSESGILLSILCT